MTDYITCIETWPISTSIHGQLVIRGVRKTVWRVGNGFEKTEPNRTVQNFEFRPDGFPNLNALFRSKTGVPNFYYCKTG